MESKPKDLEASDAELWNTIPSYRQVEIDTEIDQGRKIEAVKLCRWANASFTLVTAKDFVERRARQRARQGTKN